MDKERICLNALGTIFCYETAGALNLIQACGSAAQVFAAPANDLREMAGPAGMKYVEQIGPAALEASEALLEKMEGNAVRYITIEDDVFIGPNVTFTNDRYPRSKQYPDHFEQTVIRRGASIGAGSVILCGIEIGEGAMVGAGSVVTKNVPAGELWVGNPARFVKATDKR